MSGASGGMGVFPRQLGARVLIGLLGAYIAGYLIIRLMFTGYPGG